jgi:hypothetical protein
MKKYFILLVIVLTTMLARGFQADYNNDDRVDEKDLAILADGWLDDFSSPDYVIMANEWRLYNPRIDSYTLNQDYALGFWDTRWLAQTFIASGRYDIHSVKLFVSGGNYGIGTVTVSVQRTSGGYPDGNDLGSVTVNHASLSSEGLLAWYEFSFSNFPTLTEGAVYAIVIKRSTADDDCAWGVDLTEAGYADGTVVRSDDQGLSWYPYLDADFMFETYGE